jgi:polyvinyl alcohol dehydrogenase (cytochrome)
MNRIRKRNWHHASSTLPVLLLAALGQPALADSGATGAASLGERIFEQHCAACHSGFLGSRAPSRQVLGGFPPRSIIQALTTGLMRVQGYPLSGEQRRAVSEFLTGSSSGATLAATPVGRCREQPAMGDPSRQPQWSGWGNGAQNTSFQPTDAAGLTASTVGELQLRWAFGFPDSFSAWAQPVVASNRVFVGSQAGIFYALSAQTGCIYWEFAADAGVRSAATVVPLHADAPSGDSRLAVLFGDGAANAYALDAQTGELIWKTRVDDHPQARITGSPVAHRGRYFVPMSSWSTVTEPTEECCTFRGSLSALDIATGKVQWKTYVIPTEARRTPYLTPQGKPLWAPSGSAIWAAPTVDEKRGLVYVGTGDSYTGPATNSDSVVAFDLHTGELRWAKQLTPEDVWIAGCPREESSTCRLGNGPDLDVASPPMLVRTTRGGVARDLIVVGQKSGTAYALDPDRRGAVVWRYRAGQGGPGGGIVWGSAASGSEAYFPVSDITTASPGGLHSVDIATGERRWIARPRPLLCGELRYGCNAAQPVGVSAIPGVVFAGAVDGGFRAYSSSNGALLWEYDTNREFVTVNGVAANGGSLIGVGPTIAGGMVFVNSGYGTNGGRAGNVLLAFAAEGHRSTARRASRAPWLPATSARTPHARNPRTR